MSIRLFVDEHTGVSADPDPMTSMSGIPAQLAKLATLLPMNNGGKHVAFCAACCSRPRFHVDLALSTDLESRLLIAGQSGHPFALDRSWKFA